MQKKPYKVAEVNDLQDGRRSFVMLSPDGDCWVVEREDMDLFNSPWAVGEVIEVEIVPVKMWGGPQMFSAPNWIAVGASNPVKYDLARTLEAIADFWGQEHAEAYRLRSVSPISSRPSRVQFYAADFSNSRQMTAEMKAERANEFVQFVEKNFHARFFTVGLYVTLMHAFKFERIRPKKDIGAASIRFHRSWFGMSINRKVFFMKIADSDPNDEHNPGVGDWGRAVRAYVIQRVLPMVIATSQRAEALREQGELRWLLRKYGMPSDFRLPRQTPQ